MTMRSAKCEHVNTRPTGGQQYATRWGIVLAAALLLTGGAGYRLLADFVGTEIAAQVRLEPPLATLAMQLGAWRGEDVPVREGVLRIAGNDDYVSRSYWNTETGEVVNLFIGYTARPRTMLRHRPSVCYPSAGWSPLASTEEDLELASGGPPAGSVTSTAGGYGALSCPREVTTLPVRIQSFLRAGLSEQRVVVLNYYVLNGRPTIDENSFWGLSWRDPQAGRQPSRYVAQVQVAAAVRTTPEAAVRTVRSFAQVSAPHILELLPATVNVGTTAGGGIE